MSTRGRGPDAGASSSADVGATDELCFSNRDALLDALRSGKQRRGGEGHSSGGLAEAEEHRDGGKAKKARKQEVGAPSTTAIRDTSTDDTASVFRSRSQLLKALRGTANTPRDERKGDG